MRARKVPIGDLAETSEASMVSVDAADVHALNAAVRARALQDRDIMEKGVRSMVSHVRAYVGRWLLPLFVLLSLWLQSFVLLCVARLLA